MNNLIFVAILTLIAGPSFADQTTPSTHFRARLWNLTSGDATDLAEVVVRRDDSGKYVQQGKFSGGKNSYFHSVLDYDSGRLYIDVAIDNKTTIYAYPSDPKALTEISPKGQMCEDFMFTNGSAAWMLVFDDENSDKDYRDRCENEVAYYLSTDKKASEQSDALMNSFDQRNSLSLQGLGNSAGDKFSDLYHGTKSRKHAAIDNAYLIPLDSINIRDGGKCSISPEMVSKAFRFSLLADSYALKNPDYINGLKEHGISITKTVVREGVPGDIQQKFDQCYANFNQHERSEVQVVLDPKVFAHPTGWPKVGDTVVGADLAKRYEISCNTKNIMLRVLSSSHYFSNLVLSLNGEPIPGIVRKNGLSTENEAHTSNYWRSMGGGFVDVDRRYVFVPAAVYDGMCGEPLAQLQYASRFLYDNDRGETTGNALSAISAGAFAVAGGIRYAGVKAAGKLAAVEASQEAAPMFGEIVKGATLTPNSKAMAALVVGAVADTAIFVGDSWHLQKPKVKPTVTLIVPPDIKDVLSAPKVARADIKTKSAGGGGGGAHEKIPAPKGNLPKPAEKQILQPAIMVRREKPKLQVDPTMVAPQIKLATNKMPNLGLPSSAYIMPSNGSGFSGGIGSGSGGGIGSGGGNGYGPGQGGGVGGGVFHVGGGVSEPQVVYAPDPEPTSGVKAAISAGRKVGLVKVGFIVGSDGSVSNVKVIKGIGMGMDEEAVRVVQTWKFHPALKEGQAVAVMMQAEFNPLLFGKSG